MRLLPLSFVTLLATLGCASDPISLEDDANLDDMAVLTDASEDGLHLPYMLGAQVRLSVVAEDEAASFRVEIVDDGVLRMDTRERSAATVTAIGTGSTRVRLIDEADESHVVEREIEVRAPDELRMVARRDRLVGASDESTRDRVTILEGTTALFELRAFAGGERLHGLHGLAVAPSDDDDVIALLSPDGALSVSAVTAGLSTLELLAGTEPVATLEVNVVDGSAIDRIEIVTPDEANAEDGASLHAGAVCVARDGTRIEGPEPTWTARVSGGSVGDVLAYAFDRDVTTEVSASFAGHVDRAQIRGTPANVLSSDVRCSAVPGARGSLFVLLSVVGVALGARRRARRATKRTTRLFPAL